MNSESYFARLQREVQRNYNIAEMARAKGLDPTNHVEIPLARNLAEKVVGLISSLYPQVNNPGIVDRIIELEKEYGSLDAGVCLKIAEEIALEKFCRFESKLQAIEAGIRVAFAYTTLGVVSSPIEGFTFLKLNKNIDNSDYFVAYFSGPIRSAGTTAACMALMIIDHLREIFGYAKYHPDENEIKRTATELFDFHERVTNLQYLPTEEEILFLASKLPIQVAGEASETIEVSNYKDLPRVDTNFLRSGFCLILGEGLAQKAPKALRILNGLRSKGFKLSDWDFLEEYCKIHEKRQSGTADTSPTYIKDLVAGRPVFGHPSRSGAFRFRYGRSRVSGFSAVSIHPATMAISDSFLAVGTQIKIEKPTKGCVLSICDNIDGPIVKLNNGTVRKLADYEEAKKLYPLVSEIIYYGDILFPLGDVANRNQYLIKPGYVEEWWNLEIEKVGQCVENCFNIEFEEAVRLSREFRVPLHPNYIYYWSQIDYEHLLEFLRWLSYARLNEKMLIPYSSFEKEKFVVGKRALELLGVPHEIGIENVILSETDSKALLANLGVNFKLLEQENYFIEKEINEIVEKIINFSNEDKEVLKAIDFVSEFIIKDKAGEFIGSRMGRPEKSKLRKLTGSPHGLFPIGEEGGRFRSVQEACSVGEVSADFPLKVCSECGAETIYNICSECNSKTEYKNNEEKFSKRKIGIDKYFKQAIKKLNLSNGEIPVLIKGIRGTSSREHDVEHLCKAILRAKHNLNVNKDGTIRYDMTELPITHFKPKEISVSIKKLKEIGYTHDICGQDLVSDEQVLELMPHDIILPCNSECGDEKGDDVFVNISNFIDEMLIRFYDTPPFYNVKKREDLVGQLGVCMAPHNCAGVISRIVGFSKTQGLLASPYMHAAMRRDCLDYETYLPIKIGEKWKIKRIGEIVEELNPQEIVDRCGTKEIKVENFHTLGFNKNISEVKINNFTKHTKIPMLEIKTSLGKKIKVTENHKFLINNVKKRASDLRIGDKLPLAYKINIGSRDLKEINLLEELKNKDLVVREIKEIIKTIKKEDLGKIIGELNISKKQFQNFNVRDSYPLDFILSLDNNLKDKISENGKIAVKGDNISIPIKIKLTRELLEIIGLYIAEGYSRSISGKKGLNQVYIASCEEETREFIKKTIKKQFGLKPSENKKDRVTFSSKILYLFFTQFLEMGSNAKEKRIPPLFLNLPLEKLACVLRGYFEGDGSAEKERIKITCDSVSEGLLSDLEFCLARFGIFVKRYEYKKEPGPKVRQFYIDKKIKIPKFRITKLVIGSDFADKFLEIGFLSQRKQNILNNYKKINPYGMKIEKDSNFIYDPIISIKSLGEKESYCLNVSNENHLIVANSIVNFQCDGDEAAAMLLLDVLINFSKKFLPSHRGGTQDAPLLLNGRIVAGEVDDQILDFELVDKYPLELYEKSEQKLHSSEVNISNVKKRIRHSEDVFVNIGYTHETNDFNAGTLCSSYKQLPTMQDKVAKEMELVEKTRAVDTSEVARLIIERHFIRDIRGNLRKFSMQGFRCVKCNSKFRRPPLAGKCTKCNGKIIFTISEGGIIKYLDSTLNLAKNYDLSVYLKQNIDLTKKYIESIFGRDETKQVDLKQWF